MKKGQDSKTSPPVKVVGFRVEGATPSPRDTSLADAGAASTVTGSPSPVIIPPAFAGQSRGAPAGGGSGEATPTFRAAGLPASPPSVSSGGGRTDGAGGSASPLPPIRTEAAAQGLDPDSFAKDRTPTKSQAALSGRQGPLPLTPVGTSAPADLGGQFAAVAADSPRVVQPSAATAAPQEPPAAAAAAAASPAPAPAKASAPAAGTSPRQQQQPPAPAAAAAAAAAGAATAAAAGAAGAAADGQAAGQQPKKSMKEMTKAERRALQEAQRAAKAAAKGGQGGGGGGGAAAAGGQGGSGGAGAGGGGSGGAAKIQKQGSGTNLQRQGTIQKQGSSARDASSDGRHGEAQSKGGKQQAAAKSGAKGAAAAADAAGAAGAGRAKMMEMFAHLPQPRRITLQSVAEQKGPPVPLEAVKLGLRYADGSVRGSNARCIAMLQMFQQCIQDFRTPPGREFAKEFSPALNNIINFLVACRPLSISMGNAIKCLKSCLEKMKLQPPPTEQQAKDMLLERCSEYLEQKIRFADRMLVRHAIDKIQDGDTVMTYAYSSVVAATLLAAHKAGKRFDVVVVDSRPLLEGRRMLTTLLEAGVTCEYCHLSALSYQITEVDKVFLGAASVLSNGTVLSRVGTAAVALMAAAQRVPVLVCCETSKFHERVQLDSITHNELMDPAGLAQVQDRPDVPQLPGWQQQAAGAAAAGGTDPSPKLHLLNLAYDLMPADCVSVVVTEMGAVPPSSVAVILREAQKDSLL